MLRVEGVDAYYGPSHVLQGVSLTVEAGETVALLGRNGAGKTTTLKTIMAVVRARRGRITWNGADITGLAPYRIVQLGHRLRPGGAPDLPEPQRLREPQDGAARRRRRPAHGRLPGAGLELFPRSPSACPARARPSAAASSRC